MQFAHGKVAAVTVTTANGQKVQASVPANVKTRLRFNQTVEIKKVSDRWEVVMQPSGTSTSSGTSTPSTASTRSTPSTSPASVQACLKKAGFVIAPLVKPPSGDRKFGMTKRMVVVRPHSSGVHTIDFFSTATDATHFANTIGGGHEAFGTVAIDANGYTPDAKIIQSCVH